MEEVIRGNLPLADSNRDRTVAEGPVLDALRGTAELKSLDRAKLRKLCNEIRDVLNAECEVPGPCLESSLGVVELSVALATALNLPTDRLIWDTGHQTLAHKILTGRRHEIGRLGANGGPAILPTRGESPYDAFGTGHASTAISAALGMATARDLAHEDYRTVAVIGDGAMSGGMAYEALNNAGHSKRRMLVVLNDNGQSINPRVGTIAHHLTSIRTNPHVQRLRDESFGLIERLPALGETVGDLAKRMEQAVKTALVPGALYEALGFNYIGPIDGNDLDALLDLLPRLVDRERPTLLHVLTKRGHGFDAEKRAKPVEATRPSFHQVFGEGMVRAAAAFPNMVAITASMATGTGLEGFRRRHGERYFDVGIAESHGVCFAAGLACDGARPVATISSSFLQRAYDQVVHDVAIQKLPVVFAIERAGLTGEAGPTHHGAFDLSYLRCIPNMTIAAPKDGNELLNLLWTALSQANGPFALRYPATEVPTGFRADSAPRVVPMGSWDVMREGADLAFLAVGSMVEIAGEACDQLAKDGVEAGLVNCRFVKPLDRECLLELRRRYRFLVTVEENARFGGFGDGVMEALCEEEASLQGVRRLGLPDRFISHGSRESLLESVGLTPAALKQTALDCLAEA